VRDEKKRWENRKRLSIYTCKYNENGDCKKYSVTIDATDKLNYGIIAAGNGYYHVDRKKGESVAQHITRFNKMKELVYPI